MEKRVSLSVLFYVKRTKLLNDGKAPIYCKITYNKTYAEMAVNRGVDPNIWDPKAAIVKGKTNEARQINSLLKVIEFQLYEHFRYLKEDGKIINSKAIKDSFLGVDEDRKTILGIFQEHNDDIKNRIGLDYSQACCQKYNTCRNFLAEYIKKRYKKDDLYLSELNNNFIRYFESFLKTDKGHAHNTATKYLTNLKKITKIALANNWMKQDPFANIKFNLKKVDRGFLTDGELQAIIDLKIEPERIQSVRDSFLFSCFTGLAYADLKRITYNDIVTGTDGKKWIKIHRKKTDVISKIPILPVVQTILDSYQDHPVCVKKNVLMPVLTNQKMNAYLHEIADLAGIKQNLTTHLARHTFATTVTLNNGVPIETVSKMLGHSSINMTKTYARLLDKKVGKDMEGLHQKYAS